MEALGPGDKFTAGDFPVKVVEASGGNGRFSGKGVIEVPYLSLIKIAVVFDNININTDGQMTGGTVETAYDADFARTSYNTGRNGLDEQLEAHGELADRITDAINDAYGKGDIGEAERDALLAEVGSLGAEIGEANENLEEGKKLSEEANENNDPKKSEEGKDKIDQAEKTSQEVGEQLQRMAEEMGVTAKDGAPIEDGYFDALLPITANGQGKVPINLLDNNGTFYLDVKANDPWPTVEPRNFTIDGNAYTFYITSSQSSEADIALARKETVDPKKGIAIYLHYDLKEEVMGYKVMFAKGALRQSRPGSGEGGTRHFQKGYRQPDRGLPGRRGRRGLVGSAQGRNDGIERTAETGRCQGQGTRGAMGP